MEGAVHCISRTLDTLYQIALNELEDNTWLTCRRQTSPQAVIQGLQTMQPSVTPTSPPSQRPPYRSSRPSIPK